MAHIHGQNQCRNSSKNTRQKLRCVAKPRMELPSFTTRDPIAVTIMHIWLAAAGGVAVLGCLNLLNGYLILLFVFLIRVGSAFNAAEFCSLLTDMVSSEELPSATVLNGL